MQNSDNVFQLAKERALFGFSAIVQQALFDAEARIDQLMPGTRSGTDQYVLVAARQFIQTAGKAFVERVEAEYRNLLDRAMATMYKDWRVSIDQISTANLTLVDDDTVQTLIDVDRLVLRIRDADDANLRKLSLIIAQAHGKYDVNERENPFRPYLMARSLHNVLRVMVPEPEVNDKIFALFTDVLAARLTDFHATLRQVFETNGMHAPLMTQRNRHARSRAEFESEGEAEQYAAEVNERLKPGLQRMLDSMSALQPPRTGTPAPARGQARQAPRTIAEEFPDVPMLPIDGAPLIPGLGSSPDHAMHMPAQGPVQAAAQQAAPAQGFQNMVAGFFRPPTETEGWPSIHRNIQALALQPLNEGGQPATPEAARRPGSPELMQRLDQIQQRAAHGQAMEGHASTGQNQLFALGEQLRAQQISQLERVAVDVVGMLFELILADKSISPELREQIGRLQIPFLKAALMTPDMLRQTEHPARQLVNRMGSAAVALDPATPAGKGVEREITRVVDKVLREFKEDISVFADCLLELERFLVEDLPRLDAKVTTSAELLEAVEQSEPAPVAPLVVPSWLVDFRIDQRVIEFIVRIWLPVLEVENLQHVNEDNYVGVYRELLPDLVWSAQEKRTPEERATLMNMLPRLVRSLRSGMNLLQLTEQEARAALDQLVPVHTQLLRPAAAFGQNAQFSLDEMRHHFSLLVIGTETKAPRTLETEKFEAELAKHDVDIELDLEREESPTFESDADWLTHMQIGTCVERWGEGGYQLARLNWISKRKTLYMFMLEEKTLPVVYSAASLIKALREGSVCLLESAPVFERAVETLLSGARSLEESGGDAGKEAAGAPQQP